MGATKYRQTIETERNEEASKKNDEASSVEIGRRTKTETEIGRAIT